MRVALATDHAGFTLKEHLKPRLEKLGYELVDCGSHTPERVDYAPYTLHVVHEIVSGNCGRGIFFCGNGFAMAMLANRLPGMRAAVCHDVFTARTCTEMGNANIISLGARVVGNELAYDLTKTWLESRFLGETVDRYARRQEQLAELEARFAHPDWREALGEYVNSSEIL